MGQEIDLLKNYPRSKRDIDSRENKKTPEDQKIARKFGKDFFDSDRKYGYGGFNYNSKFWEPVVPTFTEFYNLSDNASILDVGCAKGFMLYDFKRLNPSFKIEGIDISEYAIENCKPEVKQYLKVGNATELPYETNSFNVAISITTIHNLAVQDCTKALLELQRVSNAKCFVTLDAYRNEEEKKRMDAWNLTALTVMHVDDWKEYFYKIGYKGDYYWFIP